MSSTVSKRAISIALGTSKVQGTQCVDYINLGLATGYRMIDTAQVYGNEQEIGQAVKKTSISREEIFIINKISSGFKKNPSTFKEALDSAQASIDNLGLSYVDLFLIHQPGEDDSNPTKDCRRVTWQALEHLVEEGRIKSIGVSNFTAEHILELQQFAKIYPPKVNQLELHPWCQQRKLVEFCNSQNISIQAYCAIVRNSQASHTGLQALARKYEKTTAQVLIRYSLQKGWTPIVQSTSVSHLQTNIQIHDFSISSSDMELVDSWDKDLEGSILPWLINTTKG